MGDAARQIDTPWLTYAEAAARVQIPVKALRRLVRARQIPHGGTPRHPAFNRYELDLWAADPTAVLLRWRAGRSHKLPTVATRERKNGWQYSFRLGGRRYRVGRWPSSEAALAEARVRITELLNADPIALVVACASPVAQTSDAGVYAIAGVPGFIKIGRATNIAQRIADLQVGHPVPLRLLAILSQNCDDEPRIHAAWGHLRTCGEWFREDADLLAFIASCRGEGASD